MSRTRSSRIEDAISNPSLKRSANGRPPGFGRRYGAWFFANRALAAYRFSPHSSRVEKRQSLAVGEPLEPPGMGARSKALLGIIVDIPYLVAALGIEHAPRRRFWRAAESNLRDGSVVDSPLKLDLAKLNARSAREGWLPYRVYMGKLLALSLGAFLGSIVMGLVVALWAPGRVPLYELKRGALASFLLGVVGFFAVTLPKFATE